VAGFRSTRPLSTLKRQQAEKGARAGCIGSQMWCFDCDLRNDDVGDDKSDMSRSRSVALHPANNIVAFLFCELIF